MMPTALVTRRRVQAALGLALLAAATFLPAAARAAPNFAADEGVYRVYQNDRFLGNEHVTFEQRGDSVVVISVVNQRLPHPDGQLDTLRKSSTLILAISDGTLRDYSSYELLNRDPLSRSLSMADTTYTSYRQSGGGGFGDTFARPPGRIYVVDPQVFALFDVLCRDMHAQRFDERPVTLLYIAARDTAVEGRVKRLGTGAFKLGNKSVTAEKFSLVDPWSQFFIWAGHDGRMLRMMMPATGLRVDRDPASLEPHAIHTLAPPPSGVPAVDLGSIDAASARRRAPGDSLPQPRR